MRQDLKDRLDRHSERLKAEGVRDIKFSIDESSNPTVDELTEEICKVLDAEEAGKFRKVENFSNIITK